MRNKEDILTTIRTVCKGVLTNMSFSSLAAAIPLQSSRKCVYAYILPVRYIWTAHFLRL